jgi:hypothetical protein
MAGGGAEGGGAGREKHQRGGRDGRQGAQVLAATAMPRRGRLEPAVAALALAALTPPGPRSVPATGEDRQ